MKTSPPEAIFIAGVLLGLLLAGGSITAAELVSVSEVVAPCPEPNSAPIDLE